MTFWLHVERYDVLPCQMFHQNSLPLRKPSYLFFHDPRLPQTANCVLVAKGSEGKKLAPGIFLTRMTNRLVIKTWFVLDIEAVS